MKTLCITPGSPWENGLCASFNGSLRDKLLNGEIFYTLAAALQYRQAAQLARISASGPGNSDAAMAALRFRFAPPAAGHGARDNNALTFNPDHSMGRSLLFGFPQYFTV